MPLLACSFTHAQTEEEARLSEATKAMPGIADTFTVDAQAFAAKWKQSEDAKTCISLSQQYGHRIWDAAKSRMHDRRDYDDRALYWGRLAFTQIIRDQKPAFPLFDADRDAAMQAFESASRGMDDIQFPKDRKVLRILITGFDPFGLDNHLNQSNPSGVNALELDGQEFSFTDAKGRTRLAHIEAAIFPVRFADFDNGIVEDFLRPWMAGAAAMPKDWLEARREQLSGKISNTQAAKPQVDMVVTVSMGRPDIFDLERFPGRRRSSDEHQFPDNNKKLCGGTLSSPAIPQLHGRPLNGPEFVEFSLPAAAMARIHAPYSVRDHREVIVLGGAKSTPSNLSELSAAIAAEGSGGGYLSNEISYRAIRLRNELNVAQLPVGHLHTPKISEYDPKACEQITQEIREILREGASAVTHN